MSVSYRRLAATVLDLVKLSQTETVQKAENTTLSLFRGIGEQFDTILTDSATEFAEKRVGHLPAMHADRLKWDGEQVAKIMTALKDPTTRKVLENVATGPQKDLSIRSAGFETAAGIIQSLTTFVRDEGKAPRDPGAYRENPFWGLGTLQHAAAGKKPSAPAAAPVRAVAAAFKM